MASRSQVSFLLDGVCRRVCGHQHRGHLSSSLQSHTAPHPRPQQPPRSPVISGGSDGQRPRIRRNSSPSICSLLLGLLLPDDIPCPPRSSARVSWGRGRGRLTQGGLADHQQLAPATPSGGVATAASDKAAKARGDGRRGEGLTWLESLHPTPAWILIVLKSEDIFVEHSNPQLQQWKKVIYRSARQVFHGVSCFQEKKDAHS